jgi:hypothetical protein
MAAPDNHPTGRGIASVPKLAFSIEEAMASTSIGRTKLYDDINSGLLNARKHGRKTLILADDLAAYLAALPAFKVHSTDD